MKKFLLLVLLLFAITCIPQCSLAQTPPIEIDAKTFMLSNEAPGYMIDNLIANGYGDSSMYAVMHYLQPLSGGAIPQEFMDSLAACPANSDVFAAKLYNFSDLSNNPVGIGEDGNLVVAPIYGKDLFGRAGYTIYNDTVVPVSLKLFTKAIGPDFYIDAAVRTADGIKTYYKAFAIAWSMGSTFVLSNEGGLIDDLISAGHGDKNLYQTLEVLKPKAGGVISDEFMATLANCPAGSEIFTAVLSNFAGLNNPVCVNIDGTLAVNGIFGKDYLVKDGYSTIPVNQNGYTSELFTYSNSAENYIDAGSSGGTGLPTTYYKAFAIAWKASTTFVLTNEGGLINDLIRSGNGDKNLYQTLEILKPKSGGVISDEFMATLANCPEGSEIFTAALSNFAGLNNPVCVNSDGTMSIQAIFARDYLSKEGFTTIPLNQNGYTPELFTYANSAEDNINAGISGTSGGTAINYRAYAIAWKASTTFVLSNEGGLIDDLILAGNGNKNLHQTLEILKPKSGGVISDEFMSTLANCPAGSEIFTAALSNFGGLNNPICVNTDGTLTINPIFGKDYQGNSGYATFPKEGDGEHLFTYATSPVYYIDAGSSTENPDIYRYKAFAIAWSDPSVDIPEDVTHKRSPYIYPNPFRDGFQIANLKGTAKIEIYNITGVMMLQAETNEFSFITLNNLPVGVYFLGISTGNEVSMQKIVRQ